jgi:hypothetical protein
LVHETIARILSKKKKREREERKINGKEDE